MKKMIKRMMLTVLVMISLILCAVVGCQKNEIYHPIETSADIQNVIDTVYTESDEATEHVATEKPFAYEFEWYLSEWDRYPTYSFPGQKESAKKTRISLPLVHEENSNGVNIKVEYFCESYSIYSFIQTRITYTNLTGEKLEFNAVHSYTPGAIERSDGRVKHPYRAKNETLNVDAVAAVCLEHGESYTEEVIFIADGFFDVNFSYEYSVNVYQYSSTDETKIYGFTIPIEVYVISD